MDIKKRVFVELGRLKTLQPCYITTISILSNKETNPPRTVVMTCHNRTTKSPLNLRISVL